MVRLPGVIADYSININSNLVTIRHKTNDQINIKALNTERICFAKTNLALDINGNLGVAVKVLGAVFGSSLVKNKEYVGIGLNLLDKGMSNDTLAGLALAAASAVTNDQIVTRLWTNVVGSVPTAFDKAPFIQMLEGGISPGALAYMSANTTLNASNINLVGLSQTGVEYLPAG